MPNLDKDFYLDKQGLRQLVNELETNIVASEYDTSVSYTVGQYCVYENNFYRCTTATTGVWDSTAWIKVIISDEIPNIKSITTAQWEALTPEQKASGDYVITDATTVPLTAENVPYDGTSTTSVKDVLDLLLDRIYPVGSIYMSVTDSTKEAVEARFGGTWVAFGSGKTLVGVDGNDTDFDTVEETGGSKSESYTPTGSNAAVTLTAAQSGVPAHAHTVPAHGHSMTQPVFTVNSSGKVSAGITGGSHSHTTNDYILYGDSDGDFLGVTTGTSGAASYHRLKKVGTNSTTHTHDLPNHTHTLTRSINAAVTDKAAFSSNNNTATNASQSHNHTFTGTATTINHVQPYITVYMYKRTA